MAIHEGCHLIAVIGGKGGVGKSVLAANLAAALINELKQKTLLIDADPKSCGDQNVILGAKPTKTIMDLCNNTAALTSQNINSFLSTHPSGLQYLAAVLGAEQTLQVQPDLFRRQLYSVSQGFKYIVADLGSEAGPLALSLIEDASVVLVVTTPEVLVVNQTRRLLNDLLTASVPGDFLHIVINKMNRGGVDPNSIAQNLKRPIVGNIPQDENLAQTALQRSVPFVFSSPNTPLTNSYHDLVRKLTGGILQKLKTQNKPKIQNTTAPTATETASNQSNVFRKNKQRNMDPTTLLKLQIHSALIKEMDLKKDMMNSEGDPAKEKELRLKTQKAISELTDRHGQGLSRDERVRVIKEVLDESLGLGPLEELLADPAVSEIMVNGCDQIYIEKHGKLTLSTVKFTGNLQLRTVIERIVSPLGRRIDERTPYVDARLPDGSRVNAIIEPLAIDGPSVTIRKFPQTRIMAEDYVSKFHSMTKPMMDFLKICVEEGLNVIISGGTGSGKTTLLNAMSAFIPANERIVTVEDAAELQMKQEHVVRLETRPANLEGTGEVSIRDLIKNSLRMRPDRIVVGECRDGAALDMLAAMNTGHDGSMTTVHANTPREAVSRLETLCLMSGMDLPAKAIREQIAGAVDLIVQICRLSDGSRKIISITEVVGMQGETVTLQEIFRFKEEGFDKNRKIIGQFQPMGLIPTFIESFEQRGVTIPRNLFTGASETPKTVPKSAPSTPNILKKVSGGNS